MKFGFYKFCFYNRMFKRGTFLKGLSFPRGNPLPFFLVPFFFLKLFF